jgi:hypothetical protein
VLGLQSTVGARCIYIRSMYIRDQIDLGYKPQTETWFVWVTSCHWKLKHRITYGRRTQMKTSLPERHQRDRVTRDSSFFGKFQNIILKLKNLKLNLHVDNVVIYNRANFMVEIPYILNNAKMTNSDIYNSKQCKFLKSYNLSKFVIFV